MLRWGEALRTGWEQEDDQRGACSYSFTSSEGTKVDANEGEVHTLIEHLFDWGDFMKRLDLARQVLRDTENRLGLEKNQAFSDLSSRCVGVWEYGGTYPQLIHVILSLDLQEGCCAFIGSDDFGWEYAFKQGLNLARCLYVPSSCADAQVISLLLPHCRLVYVDRCSLTLRDMRRLGAQVRKEETILLTNYPWVGFSRPWGEDFDIYQKAG